LHIVIAFVLRFDFPYAFGPQGRETVEEAERIYTEELDKFGGKDGVLVILHTAIVKLKMLSSRELVVGHFE